MITKKSIEDVKFAAKIEEVVGEHLTLKRQGSAFVCTCPFHNDKNPSMHVTPRLGIYKCFVCGAAGDSLKFLMEYNKMSYPEAIEHLADKYNITLEYEKQTEEAKELNNERDSLYLVNEFAKNWFMEQMRNTEEGRLVGMSYFKEKRQFKESTIDTFQLGYCPEGWDSFTKAALKQGYKEEYLLNLGLTKKTKDGKLFDFFRGRVIFPIHNAIGKIIGFGARKLIEDGKNTPKYFNSQENEIYHKSDTLYDIFLAKRTARRLQNVILVEGYTDVISMFEAGIENVVASSGTSLTPGQVKMLGSLANNVTVLYDGDAAGIHAAIRGLDMLIEKGINVKVCLLPDGEDPDSFAKKNRDSDIKEYLEANSTDIIDFKVRILSESAGDDPLKRSNVINEVLQSVAKVQDPILQQMYIQKCAETFRVSEVMLGNSLRSIVWNEKQKNERTQGQASSSQMNDPNMPQFSSQQEIYNPIRPEKISPPRPSIDQRKLAEKNIVLLLLKYGMYEIRAALPDNPEMFERRRIDQYVVDELYNDMVVLKDPLYRKIYEQYANMAEILPQQNDLQRYFFLHDDKEIQEFMIQNVEIENIQFSDKWEKKFDMYTHFSDNNISNLQQEVQSCLLTLKLRVVEDKVRELLKEMNELNADGSRVYSEEETLGIIEQIDSFNKLKKNIAVRLRRVISQ